MQKLIALQTRKFNFMDKTSNKYIAVTYKLYAPMDDNDHELIEEATFSAESGWTMFAMAPMQLNA